MAYELIGEGGAQDARARSSTTDSSDDDEDSARERQLTGIGREEPRTRADDYAAACQAGRSRGRIRARGFE